MWLEERMAAVEGVSLRIRLRCRLPVPGLVLTVERDRNPNPSGSLPVNRTEIGQPWRPSSKERPLPSPAKQNPNAVRTWDRKLTLLGEYSDLLRDRTNPPSPA
jgi:hypothetical protein